MFGCTPETRENKISCRNSAKKLQNKTFKDLGWGCIQLVECLPAMCKCCFDPQHWKTGNGDTPVTPVLGREEEAGGLEIKGDSWLLVSLRLGDRWCHLKTQTTPNQKEHLKGLTGFGLCLLRVDGLLLPLFCFCACVIWMFLQRVVKLLKEMNSRLSPLKIKKPSFLCRIHSFLNQHNIFVSF